MDFNISTQHTELTPALEEAVREKFNRFEDHVGRPVQAHVVLRIDNGRHVVDATVTGLGVPLVARSVGVDMYAAINQASQIISRQWRKAKTAQLALRREGSIKHMNFD